MTSTLLMGLTAAVLTSGAVMLVAYFLYPRLETFLDGQMTTYVDWIVSMRERMFLSTARGTVVLAIAMSALIGGLAGALLSFGYGWITPLFAGLFGWIGWSVPKWYVQFRWQERLKKFDLQLVDALNLMANSLKSGLNLPQVIQVLVEEMPKPIADEFSLVLSQQKLGLTIDEAMEKMMNRVPSDDLAVALNSVLILRETGGDLAETFDTIANTIRERRKIEGKINAMTQQGRTQGLILILMPFALAALLYTVNPDFLRPLLTTQFGWMMIGLVLVLQLLGGLWMRKILTIDV